MVTINHGAMNLHKRRYELRNIKNDKNAVFIIYIIVLSCVVAINLASMMIYYGTDYESNYLLLISLIATMVFGMSGFVANIFVTIKLSKTSGLIIVMWILWALIGPLFVFGPISQSV